MLFFPSQMMSILPMTLSEDSWSLSERSTAQIRWKKIEIDLDDGVKHNYAIFQDVLAKIK